MARKRRFGVSIDKQLAETLDELADLLGTDRSSLIEEAVRRLLDDYRHSSSSHECWGLLVIAGAENTRDKIYRVLEEYRDTVTSSSHIHSRYGCAEIIAVHGSSDRIKELHSRLSALGCRVRFVPLH